MGLSKKPKLVIISDSIRRDLQAPLGLFDKVKIVHLYRQANYQDMTAADFEIVSTYRFDTPLDLWRRLGEIKPTIIQGPEPLAGKRGLVLSFVVWLYGKLHRVPYFFPVLENRPIREKHGKVLGAVINWWTGIYGRGAKVAICLNNGARYNLLKAGVSQSKLVRKLWGNWGIDTREFRPLKSRKLLKLQKPVVLFVGKISEAKGVPWLLEATTGVVKKFPNAKLWLAGPIEKNFQFSIFNFQFVKYLGIVKNNKMADLYRKATVIAAPSITTKTWEEQVGNVILQAMASGVPVVATRSGAIPEYVKDGYGAALVPEKDSKALAAAILRLLANKKIRDNQSLLARRWIVDRYEVAKNIAALDKWLETLTRSK